MSNVKCHHEDRWGAILEYPSSSVMEIRWYDTSEAMGTPEFNAFLEAYVSAIENAGSTLCLVDATTFRMDPSKMDAGWRDANIIPRYNAAGVKRFAFHMPQGMPAIGAPPQAEGPASFPTGYFGTRTSALQWLGGAQ